MLLPAVAHAYPCPELLVAAKKSMYEWGSRVPESAATQVLGDWLERNAHLEVPATDEAIEAALADAPLTGYRALSLNRADNEDEKKKGAAFDLVSDTLAFAEKHPFRPANISLGQPYQVVLQHPDSLNCFMRALNGQLSLEWDMQSTILSCAMTAVFWPAGLAQAVYHGYRYLWQSQADATVLKEMQAVAEGKASMSSELVLAMRIQAPTGEDWTLMLLMAPPVEQLNQPRPSTTRRLLGALRQTLFSQPVERPSVQLKPTLVGFFHQGKKDETTPAAPVP